MYSMVRQPSALIVSVGFLSALLTNGAASVIKRFLTVPRLAVLIQHGSFRIVTHFGCAHFVNDLAARRNTPFLSAPATVGDDLPPAASIIFAKGLLHVFRLQDLILAPFEVEAQHRNTPLVDDVRIDLAIAVVIRNHFAAAGEVQLVRRNIFRMLRLSSTP